MQLPVASGSFELVPRAIKCTLRTLCRTGKGCGTRKGKSKASQLHGQLPHWYGEGLRETSGKGGPPAYPKAEEVADTADVSKTAQACRLLDAKVRFFGDQLAVVYGSETSMRKTKDGTAKTECLIWTDTWLKRQGNWQIVAAQDTEVACN
jgi:hypothetical protein